MLQSIRNNAQGLVSKVLVGLIAFTFVIWGAESLFYQTPGDEAAVTVNGEEISVYEVLAEAEAQRRQVLTSNPDIDPATLDTDTIRANAIENMIRETVILQHAESIGLDVSDANINRMIVETPDFQIDGTFNQQRFTSLLGSAGLTVSRYKEQLRDNVRITQMQRGLASSAFALPVNIQKIAALDGQTRDFSVLTLPLAERASGITISNDDIATYYSENESQFMAPEQMKIAYVTLDKSDFISQVNVSDDEVARTYEEDLASFQSTEERNVAHILFNVNDEQSEEQALAKAQDAYEQLEQGEDFVVVAANFSEDEGTSQTAGSLGPVQAGEFGGEFDAVMFELAEGAYSEPTVTQFGVQIIKLESLTTNTYPSFAELEFDIREALLDQGAEALFVSASEVMADLAFASQDLEEVSAELRIDIQTSDWIDRSGINQFEDMGSRVASAAFSDEVLLNDNNSDVIELASDKLMVLRKLEHKPEAVRPLEDVVATIREQLAQTQAQEQIAAQATDAMQRLRDGEAPSSIAIDLGAVWQPFEQVTRVSRDLSPLLSQAAFKLPRPQGDAGVIFGQASDYNGDVALIQLFSVNDANSDIYGDEQLAQLGIALGNIMGQADTIAFEADLYKSANIER